jgi:four helix bundle protein
LQIEVGGAVTREELSDRLVDFAVRVRKVVDALPNTRLGRHVAGQLIACGTSPAPNYEEARAAESRADFVHKLGVCLKELRESRSWIRLIMRAALLSERRMQEIRDECCQLCNIIGQSKATAKARKGKG